MPRGAAFPGMKALSRRRRLGLLRWRRPSGGSTARRTCSHFFVKSTSGGHDSAFGSQCLDVEDQGQEHPARAPGAARAARSRLPIPLARTRAPRPARPDLPSSQQGDIRTRVLLACARLRTRSAPTQDQQGLLECEGSGQHRTRWEKEGGTRGSRLDGARGLGVRSQSEPVIGSREAIPRLPRIHSTMTLREVIGQFESHRCGRSRETTSIASQRKVPRPAHACRSTLPLLSEAADPMRPRPIAPAHRGDAH